MSAALDRQLAHAVLVHALDVTRVEAGLRRAVMRRMLALQKDLLALLAVSGQPRTKRETDALLAASSKIIAKHFQVIHDDVMAPALTTVAKTQAAHLVKSIEQAKVPNG